MHYSKLVSKLGFFIGLKGSETRIIDNVGNIVLPSGKTLTGNIVGNASGYALKSEARTATAAPGGTTGVISTGVTHVVVTSDDANKVITLPAPVPGLEIVLQNGATGYELRTSAPGTIAINGGAAANAESAVAAATTVIVKCTSATTWIGSTVTAAGVVGVLEVAAP